MAALGVRRGQIEHMQASAAALRVKVDALLAADVAPKDVVDATLSEMRAMLADMKPLAAVSAEFRSRWRKQKTSLLDKRKAEVEGHLRAASNAQIVRMEAEAEDQVEAMHQDFKDRQKSAVEKIHKGHDAVLRSVVEDWLGEVRYADSVRNTMIDGTIQEAINRIKDWALQEETRIMDIWEAELGNMMSAVHTLDDQEIQAMEDSRFTRCRLAESAIERQQQELVDFRQSLQDPIAIASKKIVNRANPDESKIDRGGSLQSKKAARSKVVAKKEVEMASQLHVESAVKYLDEAAALEKARIAAYNTAMQDLSTEFAEQLQDSLAKETEAAASKGAKIFETAVAQSTPSGLPASFNTQRQQAGQAPVAQGPPIPQNGSFSDDDDPTGANALQMEIYNLRERARSMMAQVGRGDWRKDVLEVAEGAIDGLRRTECALAAGPMQQNNGRTQRNPKDVRAALDTHTRTFSDQVLKEVTRMRNVKVALSCARSNHVREAMQQYELNSHEIEDAVMPAVSKLAHEVEVIRELHNASKLGVEKMPVYIIAACWRRALLAAYPALKTLWDSANITDSERKTFIRKISMHLAVEPSIQPLFQSETQALEATLPAPDWAVGM